MSRPTYFQMVVNHTILPLIFMTVLPILLLCIPHLVVNRKSDVSVVFNGDPVLFAQEALKNINLLDYQVWLAIFGLSIWAALSILYLGGEKYRGPPTDTGFRPEYVHSGFRYYLITVGLYTVLAYYDVVPAWYLYKKFVNFIGSMTVFAFVVCVVLFIKGSVSPSPGPHGSSGNPIFDFYWGLELYPRFGRWFDVKLWTNSRVGLMIWQLVVLLAWKAQIERSGWNYAMSATAILQTIYLAKFYWWEDGYMKSIDIFVDRAGYYICFGCLSFVPVIYTLTSVYMVENAPLLSQGQFLIIMALGITLVGLNYWSDYQRQLCRATNGNCIIWGKPAKVVHATYLDHKDDKRKSVLLASGFWGLSRHLNYVFEILAAFLWEVPSLFVSVIPYIYLIHLTILLIHRSFRDEQKCREKYGKDWDEYCKVSKYRMIPFVF